MMNRIKVFIDKFLGSADIRTIYLTPHSPIAFKSINESLELLGEPISPTGASRFFADLLGEEGLLEIQTKHKLSKELRIDGQVISVDGFLSEAGITFAVTKKETLKTNIDDYPQIISNFMTSSSGLVIGIHQKTAQITRVERDLVAEKLKAKPISCLYFRGPNELPFFNKESFVVNVEKSESKISNLLFEDADLVRFGAIETVEDIETIKAYLRSGSFVIAHVHGSKVSDALVGLQSLLSSWESKHLLSQSLVGFYSFLNWTYNDKHSYAFEAYPFGPEAKSNFSALSSEEFFKFFEKDFKNNGLSFSQSLHTKVLKRSIDIRKAFELAPDPSDLDYILKKSGI